MVAPYGQDFSSAIRLVQIVQETEGTPGSLPFGATVYKCMPVTIEYQDIEGSQVTYSVQNDPDRAIYAVNLRYNGPRLGDLYLVYRLDNGSYVFDNQQAFLENS